MIAALLLALASTATPPPAAASWCDSLHAVALATAQARAAGMPRAQVELAAQQLPTPEARRAGAQIVHLAFDFNTDGRVPPEKFARLIREVCNAQEQQP